MLIAFILFSIAGTGTNELLDYYNGISQPSAQKARKIVDTSIYGADNNYERSVALFLSGYLYQKSGNPVKAAVDYGRCLDLLPEVDTVDYYLEISVRKNLGALLDDFGDYRKAIRYYESALPYAEQYSKKEIASLYSNMGNSYRDLRDGSKLMECYYKSLNTAREDDDFYKVAQVYNQLGLSFYHADILDTAKYFFHQAIHQQSKLSDKRQKVIGQAYHNLGQVYFNLGNLEESAASLRSALDYKTGDDRYITLMDLGEVFLRMENLEKSREILTTALELYPDSTARNTDFHTVFKHLSTLEMLSGNIEGALSYQKMYSTALESYSRKQDRVTKIATITFNRQLLEAFHEKQQNEILKRRLYWSILCVSVAFLVILIPFLIIYFNHRRLRNSLVEVEQQITSVL